MPEQELLRLWQKPVMIPAMIPADDVPPTRIYSPNDITAVRSVNMSDFSHVLTNKQFPDQQCVSSFLKHTYKCNNIRQWYNSSLCCVNIKKTNIERHQRETYHSTIKCKMNPTKREGNLSALFWVWS